MKNFISDRRGNFGMMLALVTVPLILTVGLAVDYSMMVRSKSRLQDALDGGLLAAGRGDQTLPQKEQTVEDFVLSALRNDSLTGVDVDVAESADKFSLNGVATASYQPYFMKFPGLNAYQIGATAEVRLGTDSYLDVALVLDNTGSLGATGLQAVRDAAQRFRTTIFSSVPDASRVQMAIVPFAGAVNVGRDFSRQYMDTNAGSEFHAEWMENKWIAMLNTNCTPQYNPAPNPGDGDVESFLRVPEWMRAITPDVKFAFDELLGVKSTSAQALGEAQQHNLPDGYYVSNSNLSDCRYLTSPNVLNNFDLFDGIPNIAWGGCVEARPGTGASGLDVTDALPVSSDANTLFVPYFWPDEPDPGTVDAAPFVNDYMSDQPPPIPWSPEAWADLSGWGHTHNPLKYNGTPVVYDSGGQYSSGPNRGCPEPLLPLTRTSATVQTKINSLSLSAGGGTVISEGVAWGWRVLSPRPPFTQASTGANAKRIMVVMSDGENQMSRNPQVGNYASGPTVSDYNAYNYMRQQRLGVTFTDVENELDTKMAQVCANAMADGIEIHTILFRSTSARAIASLQGCVGAENADRFHLASNEEELLGVFAGIAAQVGRYRLVR